MELNRLVFPRPASSYNHEAMKGKLIYIPKFNATIIPKPPLSVSLAKNQSEEERSSLTPVTREEEPLQNQQSLSYRSNQVKTNNLATSEYYTGDLIAKSNTYDNNYYTEKAVDNFKSMRASQPYSFQMNKGAPSIRGK